MYSHNLKKGTASIKTRALRPSLQLRIQKKQKFGFFGSMRYTDHTDDTTSSRILKNSHSSVQQLLNGWPFLRIFLQATFHRIHKHRRDIFFFGKWHVYVGWHDSIQFIPFLFDMLERKMTIHEVVEDASKWPDICFISNLNEKNKKYNKVVQMTMRGIFENRFQKIWVKLQRYSHFEKAAWRRLFW